MGNLTKDLDRLIRKIDPDAVDIAERLSDIYVTTVRSMTLCTVLAHKSMNRLNATDAHVMTYMTGWLMQYKEAHGNPLEDVPEFYRALVLATRDEVERFLGVRDESEESDDE